MRRERADPARLDAAGECCRGCELQQQPEDPQREAPLSQADPYQRGALERPRRRGPARIDRQRHRQCGEDEAERCERVDEQAQPRVAARAERVGQSDVDRGDHQRADRHPVLVGAHERGLQARGGERRAEHERAVDGRTDLERAAHRVGHRDADVEQEEQDEEGLGGGEVLGAVAQHAPRGSDDERAREAEQVQRTPGTEPGDREDARVEHRVEGEQHDVVARARRYQHRRREAAERAEHRERQRVLLHGQDARLGDERDQQDEREQRRQQVIERERGEHGEVQHADARALQRQRVAAPRMAQPPADAEQHQAEHCDAREPQLDRHADVLDRVAREEGHADEQHDRADAGKNVAAGDPAPKRMGRDGRTCGGGRDDGARRDPGRRRVVGRADGRRSGRDNGRRNVGQRGCSGARCRIDQAVHRLFETRHALLEQRDARIDAHGDGRGRRSVARGVLQCRTDPAADQQADDDRIEAVAEHGTRQTAEDQSDDEHDPSTSPHPAAVKKADRSR